MKRELLTPFAAMAAMRSKVDASDAPKPSRACAYKYIMSRRPEENDGESPAFLLSSFSLSPSPLFAFPSSLLLPLILHKISLEMSWKIEKNGFFEKGIKRNACNYIFLFIFACKIW